METKETVMERYMRDTEHKAKSLYDNGYRAGYAEGYKAGKEKVAELKVGDEVMDSSGLLGIVTNTDTHYHIFYPHNGKTWKAPKDAELKKTGRSSVVEVTTMASTVEPYRMF